MSGNIANIHNILTLKDPLPYLEKKCPWRRLGVPNAYGDRDLRILLNDLNTRKAIETKTKPQKPGAAETPEESPIHPVYVPEDSVIVTAAGGAGYNLTGDDLAGNIYTLRNLVRSSEFSLTPWKLFALYEQQGPLKQLAA